MTEPSSSSSSSTAIPVSFSDVTPELLLATTGAIVVAAILKLASTLKQSTSYLNPKIEGNVAYLLAFLLVGAVAFIVCKFNTFGSIRIMQDPEEQIEHTLIVWYGIGGILMGVAHSLALLDSVFYRVESIQDTIRLGIFGVTAYVVNSLRQPYGETESLNFILNFDYKEYNIIVLILAVFACLFAINKKLFIGILLGSALLCSQALQKDQVFSKNFLAFFVVFNIVQFVARKKQRNPNNQKNAAATAVATPTPTEQSHASSNSTAASDTTTTTEPATASTEKKSKNSQPTKAATTASTNKATTGSAETPSRKSQRNKKSSKPCLPKLIIASALSGIGYGLCGIMPEQALLHTAIFTPHITLVYLISFIVGSILMFAILQVIEFDEIASMNNIILDEYKAHVELKNQEMYLPKPGYRY